MRKKTAIFVIALSLAFPPRAQAFIYTLIEQIAFAPAVVAGNAMLAHDIISQIANFAQYIYKGYQFYQTAVNTYNQFQKMVEAEKRTFNNLRSIVDTRSLADFMNWGNRQLYLARESEHYNEQMGIKIGNNTYSAHDIDKIPAALMNEFSDPFSNELTEEEKRDIWLKMGLTPGNYAYLMAYEDRRDKIAKRIMTYSDIFFDEHEEAAARNRNMINKYGSSNEELDINEISKERHITDMNIEMTLREKTRLLMELSEFELSQQEIDSRPPTPTMRSLIWGADPFGSAVPNSNTINRYESF